MAHTSSRPDTLKWRQNKQTNNNWRGGKKRGLLRPPTSSVDNWCTIIIPTTLSSACGPPRPRVGSTSLPGKKGHTPRCDQTLTQTCRWLTTTPQAARQNMWIRLTVSDLPSSPPCPGNDLSLRLSSALRASPRFDHVPVISHCQGR